MLLIHLEFCISRKPIMTFTLFVLHGKKWIFQSDKYRLDIFQLEPTASKPVQYFDGVVVIISERCLPQEECPIANRHVQYSSGVVVIISERCLPPV